MDAVVAMAATAATTSAAMAATAAAATKIGNPQTKSARDLLLPIFCTYKATISYQAPLEYP